jgi:hypothetical protein
MAQSEPEFEEFKEAAVKIGTSRGARSGVSANGRNGDGATTLWKREAL